MNAPHPPAQQPSPQPQHAQQPPAGYAQTPPPGIPAQPYGPPSGGPVPPPVPQKKKRRWPWIVAVVAALIVAAAVSNDDTTPADTAQQSAANSTAKQDTASGSAKTDGRAQSGKPTDKSGKKKAEQAPAPKPLTYTGTGDKILDIEKPDTLGLGFAKLEHSGSSNFAVETIGGDLPQLLVNEIGDYNGTVAFDLEEGEDTNRLKLTADGNWTVKLLPTERLRQFDADTKPTIRGDGDDVLVNLTGNDTVAQIDHNGKSNFAVSTYGGMFPELLVNEIGNYSGEQLVSADSLIVVTADGDWSMRAR